MENDNNNNIRTNEIFAIEKRTRSETSVENSGAAARTQPIQKHQKTTHDSNNNNMDLDVDNASHVAENGRKIKTKRLRAPLRKLPVISNTQNASGIWDRFERIEVATNLKDYILKDKEAQRDLRDGLRFIMGRKPKAGAVANDKVANNTKGHLFFFIEKHFSSLTFIIFYSLLSNFYHF